MSKNLKKWLMTGISFAVLCTLFAVLTFEVTKKPVTVILDGKKQELSTHAKTVKTLLADLDVDVGSHDLVEPGIASPLEAGMTVKWTSAVQVNVATNGVIRPTWTTAKTVGAFLKGKNIDVAKRDQLTPGSDTKIKDGMDITYKSAFPMQVKVGGKKDAKKIWSTASAFTTVGEFLKKHDIEYSKNDEIKPGLNTPVRGASKITVNHVKKMTDVVYQPLDYDVVKKEDSSLPKGEKKVINSGSKGQRAIHYKIKKKNGKEIKRKKVKTETKRKSQDRVVAVGTKAPSKPSHKKRPSVVNTTSSASSKASGPSSQSGDSSGSSPSSKSGGGSKEKNDTGDSVKKEFHVHSTAYTANCSSGCSGTTATGIDLSANPNAKVIAVDPSVIPLGSKVWVEGYGNAIAGDTGGAINGKTIDVFFSSHSEVSNWGQRDVLIKVLD